MTGTTHLAAGLTIAALIPNPTLPVTASLAIGSLLPDIDVSTSLLGRHVPIIPKLLKHRGVTHSPLLAIVFLALPPTRFIGAGILVHLFMDLFSPDGIPLLWPKKRKYKIPIINNFVKTGGIIDNLIGCVLWAAVIYLYVCLATGSLPQWGGGPL